MEKQRRVFRKLLALAVVAMLSCATSAYAGGLGANLPGGGSKIKPPTNNNTVAEQPLILNLVEQGVSSYTFDPSGYTFSGPVDVCLKYNPAGGTGNTRTASSKLKSAMNMSKYINEVKNESGRACNKVGVEPVDDTVNNRMCLRFDCSNY